MEFTKVKLIDIAAKTKYPIGDGDHGAIKPYMYQSFGIPYIRVADLGWDGKISTSKMVYISEEVNNANIKSHLYPSDILISKTGATIGKVAIIPNNISLANTTASIGKVSIDKNKANVRFIYWYMKSRDFQREMWKVSHKSAQPGFNVKDLKNFEVPLPPLSTQKYIAQILDYAAALRDKTKQLIKEYDALAKSIFLDMFGDPVKNENGWEKEFFGKHIDVLTDYHANGSYEILNKNVKLLNIPDFALMVRTTDLEKNNFDEETISISEESYNYLEKTKVYGGEIIINKIGSAGKVYLMPNLQRPVSLGMNAFMLRFKASLNNIFIYFLLRTKYGEVEIAKRVKGAVTKTIRKDAIREIPIILPPIELQNQFAEKIALIEKQKELVKQELKESEDLFNCLLQKAFKGELA